MDATRQDTERRIIGRRIGCVLRHAREAARLNLNGAPVGRVRRALWRAWQRASTPQAPKRSAMNWFLDAATYVDDGDQVNARLAAQRGLRALEQPTNGARDAA